MWASDQPEEESPGDFEEDVIFIKDERGKTLMEELIYKEKREKASHGQISRIKVKKNILTGIMKDLRENVSIKTWLENAAQRFLALPNPLTQLFETHGLAIMSKLYDNRDEK